MSVIPDGVLRELIESYVPGEASRVAETLAPYHSSMSDGSAFPPLVQGAMLDLVKIADMIQSILGLCKQPNVVCVSASEPFERPDYMSEEVYRGALHTSLERSVSPNFGNALLNIYGRQPEGGWPELERAISLCFTMTRDKAEGPKYLYGIIEGEDMAWREFWHVLVRSMPNIPEDLVLCSVGLSLWLYLARVTSGQNELAEKLEPLIRAHAAGFLILGEKVGEERDDDDPRTFIILTG